MERGHAAGSETFSERLGYTIGVVPLGAGASLKESFGAVEGCGAL